jgi:hypothetical protein
VLLIEYLLMVVLIWYFVRPFIPARDKLKLQQALHALVTRKKSPFVEPRWMNDPWKYHAKTAKDLLVDIILEIPSLYGGIDHLEDKERFNSNLRQELQQAAYVTIIRLKRWAAKFAIAVETSRTDWQSPSSFTNDQIAGVHLKTFYLATLMIAHDSYKRISNELPLDLGIDVDDCCRKIIHCIPLFLHPSTGIFRQHLMPFPAMTAIRHLSSTRSPVLRPERDYLLSISELPEFAGMRKFMLSLEPQIFDGFGGADIDPGSKGC